MKVLVFLFVILNVYLVHSDENVSIDPSISYKVHPDPDPEDVQPQNDQIAQSTNSIAHGVVIGHQQEIPEGNHNHIQIADVRQNAAGHVGHAQEGLRHNSEVAHGLSQRYSHPIYVQQYPQPIRIFGAEASPLQQTHEQQNSIGYSTYVEHVSPKEEEEIQSALKEGSVGDIKRLVPKSGISVKLYHNEKNANLNVENQKTVVHSLPSTFTHYSGVHYKTEEPAAQLNLQHHHSEHQQSTAGLGGHSYVKTEVGEQQHAYGNSLHLIHGVGTTEQQGEHEQTVYFTQPGINSQKTYLGVNEKASAHVNSQEESSYGAGASAELNSLSRGQGYGQVDYDHSQYQKQWSLESKLEGAQQAAKNVKPFATLQYEIDPVAEAERAKGLHKKQPQPTSYIIHNNYSKHKSSGEIAKNSNHLSNSYLPKTPPVHQANRLHEGRKVAHNLLSANHINSESVKTGQNHLGHLGASAYGSSQQFKASQSDHYTTNFYSDSETAKSGQQNYISHVAKNAHVETKTSQNNFDHQKALEGSTSFDIKNAIDSTGSLIHQTNYVAPATETQHLEGIQKQQLAYVVPKIPVLIDNGIHETPIVEGQVKEFAHAGISSPQFTYHVISAPEVSGKYFHQPRTVLWADHLKQGNANGLHQSVIKLQLPREEIYQHVKAQNLEFPASAVSHISYPQQKQPYVLHYDLPVVKYPQEIHFQPKTKTVLHANQGKNTIKLMQPVTVDWSLFKSTVPNFNINSLSLKPEVTQIQQTGKKIVPILVRKRKNRSNNKEEIGVIYGKVNNNRKPSKPSHRQEKNIRVNLLPEINSNSKQFEGNGERKNEFAVSASYKVDRSLKSSDSS